MAPSPRSSVPLEPTPLPDSGIQKLAFAIADGRFRELLDAITDICIIIDRDWRYSFANQAASRFTRLNQHELIGKPVTEVYPEIIGTQLYTVFRQVMERRHPMAFTLAGHILPGGIPGDFDVRVYPFEDGLLCIAPDIAERQRAEEAEREQRILAEALRDTAATLNSTLELSEVLQRILVNVERVVHHSIANIMLVDEYGYAQVARSLGYQEHGIDPSMLHAIRLKVTDTPNLRLMEETGKPVMVPSVNNDGHWISDSRTDPWIQSNLGAPIISRGEVLGFLMLDSLQPHSFTEDQAHRLSALADQAAIAIRNARIYEAAQRSAEDLRERNNELDAFGHTVAHDLRAPLQIIIGYADLLLSEAESLDEDMRSSVQNIDLFARKMNDLINNLLLFATLRNAQSVIVPVEIAPVLESVRQRFSDRLRDRGITLILAGELPPVMGHGPWIEEVFANLVENAIKYIGATNPDPRIEIRASANPETVRYEIIDNGIGISVDQTHQLFKLFSRLTDQAGGLGIGLSIVKRIITRLGGDLGVISAPQQGSTFWFELPAPTAD
ncbi:MAG: PAS domain-containing sensor histidine kinase [Anaerolineae bacterium]|nr:PAS domain-containing sensor histidine kinase [Anaerolineae bacterium]